MDYYAFGHLDCDSVTGLYSINITILVLVNVFFTQERWIQMRVSLVSLGPMSGFICAMYAQSQLESKKNIHYTYCNTSDFKPLQTEQNHPFGCKLPIRGKVACMFVGGNL